MTALDTVTTCLSGNFTIRIQVTVHAMEIVPRLDNRIKCLVIS